MRRASSRSGSAGPGTATGSQGEHGQRGPPDGWRGGVGPSDSGLWVQGVTGPRDEAGRVERWVRVASWGHRLGPGRHR